MTFLCFKKLFQSNGNVGLTHFEFRSDSSAAGPRALEPINNSADFAKFTKMT